jgi:hypothetical protein
VSRALRRTLVAGEACDELLRLPLLALLPLTEPLGALVLGAGVLVSGASGGSLLGAAPDPFVELLWAMAVPIPTPPTATTAVAISAVLRLRMSPMRPLLSASIAWPRKPRCAPKGNVKTPYGMSRSTR